MCGASTSRKRPSSPTAPSASKGSAGRKMEHSPVLFDMGAYRGRIEPTLKDFFAGGAEGAILHLLQETNRCVTDNELLRRRLLSRGIEPGQSIIRLLTGQSPLSPDDDLSLLGTRESRQALEQYVSGPVVYELLAILCIPDLPGIDPQQNLGDSAFLAVCCSIPLGSKTPSAAACWAKANG